METTPSPSSPRPPSTNMVPPTAADEARSRTVLNPPTLEVNSVEQKKERLCEFSLPGMFVLSRWRNFEETDRYLSPAVLPFPLCFPALVSHWLWTWKRNRSVTSVLMQHVTGATYKTMWWQFMRRLNHTSVRSALMQPLKRETYEGMWKEFTRRLNLSNVRSVHMQLLKREPYKHMWKEFMSSWDLTSVKNVHLQQH